MVPVFQAVKRKATANRNNQAKKRNLTPRKGAKAIMVKKGRKVRPHITQETPKKRTSLTSNSGWMRHATSVILVFQPILPRTQEGTQRVRCLRVSTTLKAGRVI